MKRLSKVLYLPELSESEFRLIAMHVLQRWQESTQFYIDDLEKLNVRCADHWLIGFDEILYKNASKKFILKNLRIGLIIIQIQNKWLSCWSS